MKDEEFRRFAYEAGCDIGSKEIEDFKKFYFLLAEKNKYMNLTAITEYDDVLIKHFTDSLLVHKAIGSSQVKTGLNVADLRGAKLIDIGTGAGFPGIPLKICNPDMTVHLLDSLNKRIGFINEVIKELNLEKILAFHGRSEDYGKDSQYREQYDLAVSRAVADLSVLSEYCMPFVRKGGMFISYKGENSEAEIKSAEKSIEVLGGEIADIQKIHLPGTDAERVFVLIKKIRNTPGKYPRKAGTPAKEPIK